MENSEILFDNVFKSRGGLCKSDVFPQKNSLLEDSKNVIERIKQVDSRVPNVYLNLINNDSINAVVTKYKKQYFIGINVGAIYLIEAVFLRMMSNPNILPEYGNISKEIAPEKLYNAQFTSFEHYSDVVGNDCTAMPKDISRHKLGMLLSCFVTRFLTSHEYGHILCGHVGYGNSLFETFSMCEYFNSNSPGNKLEPLTSQALEMYADLYAYSVGINNILLALKEKESGTGNWSEAFFNGLDKSLKLWLFAIYTFQRLFGMYDFRLDMLKNYTHPPASVRSFFYFHWLEQQLKIKNMPISRERITNIINDVIDSVEKAFAEISYQNYNLSFLESAFKLEIGDHHLLIMQSWNNVRALTEPFAYIGLPPNFDLNQ
jgi:hypothetical protein